MLNKDEFTVNNIYDSRIEISTVNSNSWREMCHELLSYATFMWSGLFGNETSAFLLKSALARNSTVTCE